MKKNHQNFHFNFAIQSYTPDNPNSRQTFIPFNPEMPAKEKCSSQQEQQQKKGFNGLLPRVEKTQKRK